MGKVWCELIPVALALRFLHAPSLPLQTSVSTAPSLRMRTSLRLSAQEPQTVSCPCLRLLIHNLWKDIYPSLYFFLSSREGKRHQAPSIK